MMYDIIVIGAGLTGLSTAFFLKRKGVRVLLLEKEDQVGGAMRSHNENGFIFEEGPNTGVLGNPEVIELFELLGIDPELAEEKAKRRLILKNGKWYPLPDGVISFFKTPLFTLTDKLKIAFEPFRKKGTDPNESVASLAGRRIGQSFVDYAVNPFISGIYAGDPNRLITRYALPKLYDIEQNYGSFIGGSIKKSCEPKSERDKKATRKVFSSKGGFGTLIRKLTEAIGHENIICSAKDIVVKPREIMGYEVLFLKNDEKIYMQAVKVVSTIGAHSLPSLLPFLRKDDMEAITNMNYAKVIQIAVGIKQSSLSEKYVSFGGLIPQKENKRLLGVLFPSVCFSNRSPEGFVTLAIYMGGMGHPEYMDMNDKEIESIVYEELFILFEIPKEAITFMKIFRHPYAIPQYELSSGKRFKTIHKIEKEYTGLIIAGNLRNGIGIADRIKQAYTIAENIS